MRHPSDGTLRRLLDEPAGVAEADREHIAGCPVCLSGLASARADAALAGAALDADVAVDPSSVDAGWRRLSDAVAADPRRRSPAATGAPRWRAALRSPVIAVVAVLALLTGASAAAAADWLQIFRTQQIAPVSINRADLVALPDLSAYGDLDVTQKVNVREVADATAAEKASGLSLPKVSKLPAGVTGDPAYRVVDRVSATFTFSARKAAQAAEAAGETLPAPPAGLDGSRFRLNAGPGLAAVWLESRGVPALVVARAVAPTAFSSGVPFDTARDYLLSPSRPAGEHRVAAAELLRRRDDAAAARAERPAEELVRRGRRRAGHGAHVTGRPAGGRGVGQGRRRHRGGRLAERRRGAVGGPRVRVAMTAGPALDAARQLLADLPPAPAVWCSGLRKRYRRQTAVDGVSFTVGRGEVVGLLGPNGAGKTSVIKILLGLVRPDAGEVLLLGRPAADPHARARVGYLPGALPVPAVAHRRRGADPARPARRCRGAGP